MPRHSFQLWNTVRIALLAAFGIVAAIYLCRHEAQQIHFFDAKREKQYTEFIAEMSPALGESAASPDEKWKKCCPELLSSADPIQMQFKAAEKKEIYAHCLLFDGLKRSIPAKQSYFHREGLFEEIIANLDITCIGALAGLQLPEGTTFSGLKDGQVVSTPRGVCYESEDVIFDIRIVAATDIDCDGFEDIAALVLDQAKLGTFLSFSPVSLSRKSAPEGSLPAQ